MRGARLREVVTTGGSPVYVLNILRRGSRSPHNTEIGHLMLGSFSKPHRQRRRECHQTKGLMSNTVALQVRCKSLYISLQSSAKQQHEMTKFFVYFGERELHWLIFRFFLWK